MAFYIKEWADKTATLMTREGHHLFSFRDVESALGACGKWYGIDASHVIPHIHPEPNPHFPLPQDQSAA